MSVYLYVIGYPHTDFGYALKVGIAGNIGARIASLQTGNPDELALFFSLRFENREIAVEVEHLFHNSELADRIRGEWVCSPPDEVVFYLSCITARVLSRRYADLQLSDARRSAGLLDAFEITDRASSAQQEAWNERLSIWDDHMASLARRQ